MEQKRIKQALVGDHKHIRKIMKQLKKEVEKPHKEVDESQCIQLFRDLKMHVTAHSKAEEQAFYSVFTTLRDSKKEEELRQFAFEGFEEHSLVDQLLKDMETLREVGDEFKAKASVVCDLLEHHIKEEETRFLPAAEKVMSVDDQVSTADEYRQIYQEIMGSLAPNQSAAASASWHPDSPTQSTHG